MTVALGEKHGSGILSLHSSLSPQFIFSFLTPPILWCLWGKWDSGTSFFSFLRFSFFLFLKYKVFLLFFQDFIYLFLERGDGKETTKERNINVWLPLGQPLLETWHATRACALTGNRTCNHLVHRLTLNPLSHTSQGSGFLKLFLL